MAENRYYCDPDSECPNCKSTEIEVVPDFIPDEPGPQKEFLDHVCQNCGHRWELDYYTDEDIDAGMVLAQGEQ